LGFVLIPLLAVPLVPVAGAQTTDGSDASGGTLYAHVVRGASLTFMMNSLAVDGRNTGNDDGYNIIAFGAGQGTASFSLPMDPALSAPLALTKGADVVFDLWVGGSGPDQNGQVTVAATLKAGSTAVATTAASSAITFTGDMHEVILKAPAQVAQVPATDNLVLQVDTKGAATFIHLGTGGATQSKLTLPAIPGPGTALVTYQNLTGPSVSISTLVNTTQSRADHYNWTTSATAIDVGYNVTRLNGTVQLRVLDGAGATVLDQRINATGSAKLARSALASGTWRILVNATAFRGAIQLSLAPPAVPVPSGAGTITSTNTTTASPTAAMNGTRGATASTTSKGSGAPEAAAFLALVGVVVVARRRRD